jgi:hypothetical protein
MDVSIVRYLMVAGLVMSLLLSGYVAISLAMGGRGLFRRRKVTREVWCRDRRRIAVVNFVERTRDGLTTRQVRQCSLLEHGKTCGEGCRYLPFETPAADVDPVTTRQLAG